MHFSFYPLPPHLSLFPPKNKFYQKPTQPLLQIAMPENEDLTVQQFLEAECERLEQHIRVSSSGCGNQKMH